MQDLWVRIKHSGRGAYRKVKSLLDPLWYYSNPIEGKVVFTSNGMFSLKGIPSDIHPLLWYTAHTLSNYHDWDSLCIEERKKLLYKNLEPCYNDKRNNYDKESCSIEPSVDRILYKKVGSTYKPIRVLYPPPEIVGIYTFDTYKGYTNWERLEKPTDEQVNAILQKSITELHELRRF